MQERIRESREALGFTYRDVAGRIGVSEAHMRHVELGTRGLKLVNLIRLADVLHVSLDYLTGRSNKRDMS
jgi:transcriptional regulator with XRE-family HTH domain